jgi:hypothetical protein
VRRFKLDLRDDVELQPAECKSIARLLDGLDAIVAGKEPAPCDGEHVWQIFPDGDKCAFCGCRAR